MEAKIYVVLALFILMGFIQQDRKAALCRVHRSSRGVLYGCDNR
jgi:hypothetical protein